MDDSGEIVLKGEIFKILFNNHSHVVIFTWVVSLIFSINLGLLAKYSGQ